VRRGFSLIETLVVIGVFAVIATVVARATTVSLLGTRKSDASAKVRENLNLAMGVIERQLRSARAITSPPPCDGTPYNSISYIDQYGDPSSFTCNPNPTCSSGTNTYVASGSASVRLTNPESICITDCEFTCSPPVPPDPPNLPPTVQIVIEGTSKETSGIEDTAVRLETGVSLRAY